MSVLKQLWPALIIWFSKLPSDRLLQYHRLFDKQESGWNYDNYSYSIQSKLGVLIFAEMTIKEVTTQ